MVRRHPCLRRDVRKQSALIHKMRPASKPPPIHDIKLNHQLVGLGEGFFSRLLNPSPPARGRDRHYLFPRRLPRSPLVSGVSCSRLLTIRAIFLSDGAFGEPNEAWPRWRLPAAGIEPQAFVGDQMTHGGQKGFGMTNHGRSGHATRSPRFRFLQKLEAQKNDRKDRSRIKDPKPSVEELFHPRKPT